jgi:hypothetical protein
LREGRMSEKILCSLGKGSYIARLRISGVSEGSRPERIFCRQSLIVAAAFLDWKCQQSINLCEKDDGKCR